MFFFHPNALHTKPVNYKEHSNKHKSAWMLHKTKADSYFLFPDIHPVTWDSLKTAQLRELITAHSYVVTCEQFNKKKYYSNNKRSLEKAS